MFDLATFANKFVSKPRRTELIDAVDSHDGINRENLL